MRQYFGGSLKCHGVSLWLQLDDWQKLQLTQQSSYGGLQPRRDPMRFKGVDTVWTMLSSFNQTYDTLYYETLDVPLPELEKTCKLKARMRLLLSLGQLLVTPFCRSNLQIFCALATFAPSPTSGTLILHANAASTIWQTGLLCGQHLIIVP